MMLHVGNDCECGCGEQATGRFVRGHNRRLINAGKVCLVPGCDRPAKELDRCRAHAEHYRRHGIDGTGPVLDTPLKRFLAKVNQDGPLPPERPELGACWLWTGATASEGRYGTFGNGSGGTMPAHRWSYEHHVGPITEGLDLDHLCRVTLCVRPSHLEPVTHHENVMRGSSIQAANAIKTHCRRGHELTPENVRVMAGGGRQCLVCDQEIFRPIRAEYARAVRKAKREGLPKPPWPGIPDPA